MKKKTYVFTNRQINTDSHTYIVNGGNVYSTSKGYGFVVDNDQTNAKHENDPALNFGFAKDEKQCAITNRISTDEKGCYMEHEKSIPMYFRIDVVRPGNYEVTVKFYAKGEILIFAGTRRLVYRNVFEDYVHGEHTFTMNVCDMIQENDDVLYEKRCIDISIVGINMFLESISYGFVNCPTIYVAGDMTVKDMVARYPYSPASTIGGWGQMLSVFLKKGVAISNHSKEKMSIEEYRQRGDFSIIKSHLRIGDYVLFHFSNQQENHGSWISYQNHLVDFIEETRAMGAYPIIVTPFCRCIWYEGNGGIIDIQDEYATVCKSIGETYHVPIVDLHDISKKYILQLGKKKSLDYYTEDGFFLNDIGAFQMAKFVCELYIKLMEQVKKNAYTKLAHYFQVNELPWEVSNT